MHEDGEVVVVGDVNVDHILVLSDRIEFGGDVIVKEFKRLIGGSATITAIYLSLLGLKTTLIASIGDDVDGDYVLSELKRYGVIVNKITIIRGAETGKVFVIEHEGERTMLSYRGANRLLSSVDLSDKKNITLLHVSGYALLENPQRETTLSIVKEFKKKDVIISFDPGPLLARLNPKYALEFIRNTHIVLLNEYELTRITGIEDVYKASRILVEEGGDENRIIVVKRGTRGVLGVDKRRFYECIPKRQVDARIVVGAGDVFNAGFIAGFLKRYSILDCLKIACSLAKLRVLGIGPRKVDIRELLADKDGFTLRTFPRSV